MSQHVAMGADTFNPRTMHSICLINEMIRYYNSSFKIFLFSAWNFPALLKSRTTSAYLIGIEKGSLRVPLLKGPFWNFSFI